MNAIVQIVALPVVAFLALTVLAARGPAGVPEGDPTDTTEAGETHQPNIDSYQLEPFVRARLDEALDALEQSRTVLDEDTDELAERYAHVGILLHAYQLHQAADWYYQRALAILPQRPAWKYYSALNLIRLGRPEEAAERVDRLLELPIEDPVARHAFRLRLADLRLDLADLETADRLFRQALSHHAACARALAGRGRVALTRGEFETATTLLERALRVAPSASQLHYWLGMAYRGMGDLTAAHRHLAQAGETQPPSHDPFQQRLQLLGQGEKAQIFKAAELLKAGMPEAAVELLQEATHINPESTQAWINLGSALARSGRAEEAKSAYRTALSLAPDNANAHSHLAILLTRSGNQVAAIEEARAAVAVDPDHRTAHFVLGYLLLGAQEYDDAESHFRKARELDPRGARAWIGEAAALVERGFDQPALDLLEQGRHVATDSDLLTLAQARLLAAAPDGSVRDGARAYELALSVTGPDLMVLQFQSVALALAEQGDCARAAEWQQRAAEESLAQGQEANSSRIDTESGPLQAKLPCRPVSRIRATLYSELLGPL